MKKTTYKQPILQVQLFVAEDVIRTSNITFQGYSSENWA